MTYSRITATGSYLPQKVVTNDDLSKIMDTTDEWIVARTGIKERRIADASENSIDLAYHAAVDALENSELDAKDLDLIIVATSTPAYIFPNNATQLQTRLGCQTIPAFDIEVACSGFIYAFATADAYIKSGMANHVLVVGAEVMSANLDWEDRTTAVLFGDGAGAVILSASNDPGIHASILHSNGKQKDLLYIPGGSGEAANDNNKETTKVHMKGSEVFKYAVRGLSSLVGELLEKCEMDASDIDYLIPHQANLRIIKSTADHLNLSIDKVIVTVDKHANTSAASVPLALDFGIKSGKVQRGDTLLLEAFGSGFTWGGSIVTY